MKKKRNVEYFPYLPNSKIEDNKRYKEIVNKVENNPFAFHKRKSPLMNLFSAKNNDDKGRNQELLFFQRWHDKDINLYNNYMKIKSETIDLNAKNYLNYLSLPFNENNRYKNIGNESKNQINNEAQKENIDLNIINNNLPILNRSNSSYNLTNRATDKKLLLFKNKGNLSQRNIFVAGSVKSRRSDITNPFYFNEVGEEIIKLNNDALKYNIQLAEEKAKKKILNKRSNRKEDITISPEKIRNRNYYNLGESSLSINPILNKGSYFISGFKSVNNNHSRKKSDLMIN